MSCGGERGSFTRPLLSRLWRITAGAPNHYLGTSERITPQDSPIHVSLNAPEMGTAEAGFRPHEVLTDL